MFHSYAAMTMAQRDAITAEWLKTIRLDDVPATTQKPLTGMGSSG